MSTPSGVALLAALEGEAQARGTTEAKASSLQQLPIDWDAVAFAVRDAINNADGYITGPSLQRAFAHHNLIIVEI